METNKQLELASRFVQFTNKNIFLTGKAGTGKTTFLKNLKEHSPKRMIVVAPTGVAAINAGGVTIHSFFQLSFAPQIGDNSNDWKEKRFSKEKINIIRSLDLLVIDEISMVRADVLDAIDRVLRRFKYRMKPFGGAQVLMIGDLQQLAPVIKRDEWELLKTEYETGYFFSSKVLKQTSYVSIELTHVYRQQDDRFISILNKVRDNCLDKPSLDLLNNRFIPGFSPAENEGYISLCAQINDFKLRGLPEKSVLFRAEIENLFPEYAYPTDFNLNLKVGAQVMFVKNDPEPEKRFFNGKIGKITAIGEDAVTVLCPGETEEIDVTPLIWENVKYSIDEKTAEIKEEVEGTFTQLPLKLAWAITIHKSQGLTFEKAVIDADASFAHGQVYVALSRCKSLEGLVLRSAIAESNIITDNTIGGFIRQVEEQQPGECELEKAKNDYQKEMVSDLFKFSLVAYLLNLTIKLIEENSGSFPAEIRELFVRIKEETQTLIVEVAEKFQTQIEQLLAVEPDIEKNARLLERISRGAGYFAEKLGEIVVGPLQNADLDIDNRALRKQFTNYIEGILEDISVKNSAYKICIEGFDVKKILDARARVLVEPEKKQQKAKPAEPQTPTVSKHPRLYARLRNWRNELAEDSGVPVYMIFSQKALIQMSNLLPVTTESLFAINGFGHKKVAQFGAEILDIIQQYCDENNLTPVSLFPKKKKERKEKPPKTDTKRESFELFKAGKTIAEIAEIRQFVTGTIEGHLAHFISSGELDIHAFLSDEKLSKLQSFKPENEANFVGEAKNHFGDEFSFGELKMFTAWLKRVNW
jgi:hypothetical protein